MPAAVSRAFGFEAWMEGKGEAVPVDKYGGLRYRGGGELLEDGGGRRKFAGLGAETGVVVDGEGKEVEGGRLLCRGSWNAALYGELAGAFDAARGDVWVHKNRMSGLWGAGTELERVLEREGVRTLLFAGVNTDQCVGGTYQDAFSKGALGLHSCGTCLFERRCTDARRLRLRPPLRRLRHHVPGVRAGVHRAQRGEYMGFPDHV